MTDFFSQQILGQALLASPVFHQKHLTVCEGRLAVNLGVVSVLSVIAQSTEEESAGRFT